LDEEHYQERNDRCSGVGHKLPGVGEVKQRTCRSPNEDD